MVDESLLVLRRILFKLESLLVLGRILFKPYGVKISISTGEEDSSIYSPLMGLDFVDPWIRLMDPITYIFVIFSSPTKLTLLHKFLSYLALRLKLYK